MALNGIQIFKLTPKKNCKECGCPTCMAFSMKVASGAVEVSACPKMAPEALAKLADCSSLKELNEKLMESLNITTADAKNAFNALMTEKYKELKNEARKEVYEELSKQAKQDKEKALIEAVMKEPNNIEIRYLRYLSQEKTPKFLGYNKNIEDDKAFVLREYKNSKDEELVKQIKKFLKN